MKTWSAGADWSGFKPLAYRISTRAWDLPVAEVTKPANGASERVQTTAGAVLVRFREEHPESIEPSINLHVKTAKGDYVFDGPSFNVQILYHLVAFEARGSSAFDVQWFWYDSDSVTDDPHESFSFFVVGNDAIVAEDIRFSDYRGNGFDPTLFELPNFEKRIWFREPDWYEANVKYWYRRFYKETRTGQLMVLRSDEPPLFYFEEGRWTLPLAVNATRDYLLALKRSLWWYGLVFLAMAFFIFRRC